MYPLAIGIIVAMQVSVTPPAHAVSMLRQLMKSNGQEEAATCSIPLLEARVAKNVERMPALRPPARPDRIDHMPLVKLPAPPCEEEKR